MAETYSEVGSPTADSGNSGADSMWELESQWELSSLGGQETTGLGGGHNLVPDGTIGEEFRSLKEALNGDGGSGSFIGNGGSTPQRDQYHGRIAEPKCVHHLSRSPLHRNNTAARR